MEQLSKARIKLIHSLQHKKYRLKYDKFIVEGLKITKELVEEHQNIVESVYISNPDYQSLLVEWGLKVQINLLSEREMKLISQMSTPPGILCVCTLPAIHEIPEVLTGRKIFYLDAVRDPGNLGTILRVADWFGMAYIFLSPDCVDIYNPKVVQASMTSFLRVKVCEVDPSDLMNLGSTLYVCDMDGTDIGQLPHPKEGIFVLGNEARGVSDAIQASTQNVIAISKRQSLGAESLNVASVAAILGAWLANE